MRIALMIPLVLAALPAAAASPIADVLCDLAPRMDERMRRQGGASLASTGLRSPDEMMQLWLGPRGDWTMVIAYASGTSCIVAMGEAWSDMEPPAPDPT